MSAEPVQPAEILHELLNGVHLIGHDEQGNPIIASTISRWTFRALCEWAEHDGREPDMDFEEEPDLEPNVDDEEDDPHGEDPGFFPVDPALLANIPPHGKELAKSYTVPVPSINVLGRYDKAGTGSGGS